jgi:O-6-methylguanine DNA methyltransferase
MTARTERRFRTPWGEGTLVVEDGRLVEVDLPVPSGPLPQPGAVALSGAVEESPGRGTSGGVGGEPGYAGRAAGAGDPGESWARQIEAFFSGERRSWTAEEIRLDEMPVSGFARDVYRALLQIGPGETVSYAELALLAGYPRAARAVGTAMAANPLALVIPCHRVVRSDGSTGRYGQCDALKPYLLALEGAL